MKNFKYILVMLLAFTISTSCDDDEIKLTQEELLVLYSPWDYVGIELVNIVNNGNPDFNKEEWEDNLNSEIDNFILDFKADGTLEFIERNPPNPDKIEVWNWEIINGNQIKIYQNERSDEVIYDYLKVTETNLEFTYKDFNPDENVTADLVYFFE
jgi:hypothetical protein